MNTSVEVYRKEIDPITMKHIEDDVERYNSITKDLTNAIDLDRRFDLIDEQLTVRDRLVELGDDRLRIAANGIIYFAKNYG